MKKKKEDLLKEVKIHWSTCDWNGMCWRLEVVHGGVPVAITWMTMLIVKTKQRGKEVKKHTVEVLHTYVREDGYRRKGLLTRMQKEILKHADIIRTGGTGKASVAFMKKHGYKYVPEVNEYVFNKR